VTHPSPQAHSREADRLLAVFQETCDAVRAALDSTPDWGLAGTRHGQHHSDLTADAAALEVLGGAGLDVLSEESGITDFDGSLLVVVDPLDGSSNAARGIPWYATAICALDADGPLAAVVANQATGERFSATRGGGAFRDGSPIRPTECADISQAMVGITAWPREHLGWRQFRAMGAAALDICAVAAGVTDGFLDCTVNGIHGVWDYLAAFLVCTEAGASVGEAAGRDWALRDPTMRRAPVAAATSQLLSQLTAAHREHLAPHAK
jgi:myo-inositol-1(or 4)-monophosphatase